MLFYTDTIFALFSTRRFAITAHNSLFPRRLWWLRAVVNIVIVCSLFSEISIFPHIIVVNAGKVETSQKNWKKRWMHEWVLTGKSRSTFDVVLAGSSLAFPASKADRRRQGSGLLGLRGDDIKNIINHKWAARIFYAQSMIESNQLFRWLANSAWINLFSFGRDFCSMLTENCRSYLDFKSFMVESFKRKLNFSTFHNLLGANYIVSGSRKFIDVLFEHAKKLLEFLVFYFLRNFSSVFVKWVLEDVMNSVLFIKELAFCAFRTKIYFDDCLKQLKLLNELSRQFFLFSYIIFYNLNLKYFIKPF